ncbi:MAG: DNA-binding protein [Desulfocapsaceae bacterium]|nr:DNA-binding protein [Desulfocapsaceae bacterium]
MNEWYTCKDLAGIPGLPGCVRGVLKKSERENWQYRVHTGRGGGREYHISSLPEETRIALAGKSIAVPEGMPAGLGLQVAQKHAELKEQTRIFKEHQLAQFSGLPQEKQEIAYSRQGLLKACNEFIKAAKIRNKKIGMANFCQYYNSGEISTDQNSHKAAHSLSVSTLQRWDRLFNEHGLIGLINGYTNPKKGSTSLTNDQQDFCIGLMISKPHISLAGIDMAMTARFPDPPHASSIRRFVKRWKRDNDSLLLYCNNPDSWRNKHLFAVGDASEQVERMNQVWEFDSTPADVMLADGRHSLIGTIDVYTRRLKLLVSKTSRATAVAALIRSALLDWGVPEIAKTDNGADYVSKHIVGVFGALGIEQILCPPFTPQAKPHIERSFKTFAHSFQELMPNFIGHSVAERKDIEARKSFAERLGQLDSVVEINMTSEELQSYCDRWCSAIYHQNKHRGLNDRSPAEVARAWRGTERRISDIRALDILLAEAPDSFRTVTKKGVRVDKVEYISAELAGLEGKTVRIKLDPTDLGTIYLFDEDGAFLCIAQDPVRTGINRAETAARLHHLQNEKIRQAKKAVKKIAKEQALDQLHEEILASREKKVATIIDLPKPSVEYTTPGLDEAAKAAQSMEETTNTNKQFDNMLTRIEDEVLQNAEQIAKREEKIVILRSDADTYDQIRSQAKREKRQLTKWEYDWLTQYYETSSGRTYRALEGDLREKVGMALNNQAEA